MTGSAAKIAERMRYWCVIADLGYDQYQRFDIWDGGETDCSALYLFTIHEAGYMGKPTWGNTDTLRQQLEPLGFVFRRADNRSDPPAGVGRLRNGHVAVSMGDGTVAQASIDEHGKIHGGQAGDQTGRETNISPDPRNWLWDIYPPDIAPSAGSQAPSTSIGGERVYYFGHVQRGKTGTAVKMLQAALNIRAGAGLDVDGSCGPATETAIKNWQSSHDLEVDGSCGPATWQLLLAA